MSIEIRNRLSLFEVKLTVCQNTAADALLMLRESDESLMEGNELRAQTLAGVAVQLLQGDSELCHQGSHPEDGYVIREITWQYPDGCDWKERKRCLTSCLEQAYGF